MNPLLIIFSILVALIIFLIVLNKIATTKISWHTTIFGKRIGFDIQPFAWLKTWFIDPVSNTIANSIKSLKTPFEIIRNFFINYNVPSDLASALAFTIIFVFSIGIIGILYKIIGG